MTVEQIRERITAAETRGAAEQDPAMTIIGRSTRGLGVRPKLLAHNPDGTKTYLLTLKQCRRLLALHAQASAASGRG